METGAGPDVAVQARIRERVSRRVGPLMWTIATAFAFFTLVTVLVRPPGATVPLALIDASGALLMAIGALFVSRARTIPHANAWAAGALILTLAASLAAIKLLHLPAQTTNVILVELVGSMILLSTAWTTTLILASIAGWFGVAASEGFGEAWLDASFAVIVTSILSVMIQIVRLRDAQLTERLLFENEDRTHALERVVEEERSHSHELAVANDSLEAFAYVIAHDLKEPIRSTRFFLDEALETRDDTDRRDLLQRAAKSQEELDRLVSGLLEWGRATTSTPELDVIDTRALLDDATTRQVFERVLIERRAKLLVESTLPRVLGTAPLLRQVFGNLILNAIKHNDAPEPHVRIFAASDAPRGTIDIIVQDNGPGFPASVIEAQATGGSSPKTIKRGFGLAIATRAAERLGGNLHFQNRTGETGAEVHVLLASPERSMDSLARRVRELV